MSEKSNKANKVKEQQAAVAAEETRPSSSVLEPISSDEDPDVGLDFLVEDKLDLTNTYHFLASTDWYQFTPKQLKGITAMVKQMSPGSTMQYCQIAVSSDKTPDDTSKLRTMVYNSKRWVGHDLDKPLAQLKKKDVTTGKPGLPLVTLPPKPQKCPACAIYI